MIALKGRKVEQGNDGEVRGGGEMLSEVRSLSNCGKSGERGDRQPISSSSLLVMIAKCIWIVERM